MANPLDVTNLIDRVRFAEMPHTLRRDLIAALEELIEARSDLSESARVIEDLERALGDHRD